MNLLTHPDRLHALRESGLLDTPPEPEYDRLTALVCRVLDVPVALVSLVDEDRQFFKSHQGLEQPLSETRQTPLSHSFCQHVVTGGPLRVDDARTHTLVCDNPAIADFSVEAYLGVPLSSPGGQVIGSLCAIDTSPRTWQDADIAVLSDISAIVTDEILLRQELAHRKQSENTQQTLIGELHHRVRNTLTTVQALVRLSATLAPDLESFQASIVERISAMERCHDAISQEHWQSASLRQLAELSLAPYRGSGRIALTGDDVWIPASSALSMSMIFHELVTNAVKYGGLSSKTGKLDISWQNTHDGTDDRLRIAWVETGGAALSGHEHHGFGRTLIERLAGHVFDGRAEFDFDENGMQLHLDLLLPKA